MVDFRYKVFPEDFVVEEVPQEPFSGSGHWILKIRKVGVSTLEVISSVSAFLRIPEKEIGYLGLKDAKAVSYQFISVPAHRIPASLVASLEGEGFEVLEVLSGSRKLRAGHLKGNRFRILLRDVVGVDELKRRLERISHEGFPNFFDSQRFSKGNLDKGLALLKGERVKAPFYLKRLYVSAVASWVFNLYLERRIAEGLYPAPMEGDLVLEDGFWVPLKFSQFPQRAVPTGPILGFKMPLPSGKSLEFEMGILREVGIELEAFKPFKSKGSRRAIRVFPQGLTWDVKDEGVELSFFLPRGSYATCLLKWLKGELP